MRKFVILLQGFVKVLPVYVRPYQHGTCLSWGILCMKVVNYTLHPFSDLRNISWPYP